jgi:hypothetical protein
MFLQREEFVWFVTADAAMTGCEKDSFDAAGCVDFRACITVLCLEWNLLLTATTQDSL